jgi:hypothetical protein
MSNSWITPLAVFFLYLSIPMAGRGGECVIRVPEYGIREWVIRMAEYGIRECVIWPVV